MKPSEAFDGALTNVGELNAPRAGALTFDATRYRKYVENSDLTEEQQVELLKTLFSIMSAFVAIGFGVDSVQQVIPGLGESSSQEESGISKQASDHQRFNSARDRAQGHVD